MPPTRVPEILETLDSPADVRIVLIPGLGPTGPPVLDWGICRDPWQRLLKSFSSSSVVCTIDHGVTVDSRFDFIQLIEAGERLQDRLVEICGSQSEKKNRPLLLIAHSLGGTILKQALYYLKVRASSHLQYAHVLNLVSGVIFIGGPHGLDDYERLKKHVLFLISNCASGALGQNVLAKIGTNFNILYEIHDRFTKASFRFSMLSFFESHPYVKKGLMRPKRQLQVVDEKMARIDDEPTLEIPGDHFTSCHLSGRSGAPSSIVVDRLKSMVESACDIVDKRTHSYEIRLARSKTPSLRTQASFEAMRKAFAEDTTEAVTTSIATRRGSPVFAGDMDAMFERFSPNLVKIKLPCFMMDPSFTNNRDFFGRADILHQLDNILLPDPESVSPSTDPTSLSIAALYGMAGLGKTEIAMHFVFNRRDQFDAVFWVCADNDTKLEADFCRIASELGLQDEAEQPNPTITKNKVKDWLTRPKKILDNSNDTSNIEEATWLLVFDNADVPDLLRDYLDIYGKGSILITSRDPAIKDCHPDTMSIDLRPFENQEASDFLDTLTNKNTSSDEGRQIAYHLGGLPLAIAQMAGIIRNQFLSYADLLESLDNPEELDEYYKMEDGVLNKTARGNMSSIWMINQLSSEARLLLEIVSCLFPDRIADGLLKQRRGGVKGKLIVPMTPPTFNKARAILLHWSLLRHNEEKKEIWMHRVPRQVVKSTMSDESKSAAFASAIELVTNSWPEVAFEKRHNKATIPAREKLLPHVASLIDFYERDWGHEHENAEDAKVIFSLATLVQETAWYLYERGNLTRARPRAKLAHAMLNRNSLKDYKGRQDLLSRIYDTLGCIANGTNKPQESMKFNGEFLSLRKSISLETGVEGFPLAYAHNQMGCARMMAKEYEKGRELFSRALEIWHNNPQYKKGLASMEFANLGLSHWLIGDLEEASRVLEEGLKEREEGFGRDNPESFR
ncbi:hypothetical protein Neosp_011119 [[Neocosmospora] mangrovei]